MSSQRPKREHDTLTASERMRLERRESALGFFPASGGAIKSHGLRCGDCCDFAECSQVKVRNAKPDQTYCAWKNRTWRPKDGIAG